MANKKFEFRHKYNTRMPVQGSNESDYQYYQRIAGIANGRLELIEKYHREGGEFADMINYAYRNAQHDMKQKGIGSNNRFNETIQLKKDNSGDVNTRKLHQAINAVESFLSKPTSLKSATKAVYQKRASTINQKFGYYYDENGKRHKNKEWKKVTWDEMARYYQSDLSTLIAGKTSGSDTVIRDLGAIRRIAKNPDEIKRATEGHLKLSESDAVAQAAKLMLQNGLNPEELFNIEND